MTDGAENYQNLRLVRHGPITGVTLSRPKVRNAFNDALIGELTHAFLSFVDDRETRVVVLSGEGPVFCAGADIEWMRKAGTYSRAENEADAERMAAMLRAMDTCPKPVVACAHGAAIGGGVGLLATADIAVASEETIFSLAEVKLGIVPSVISPYVLRAIGPREARRFFLTGERFDAREAHRIGLVHAVAPAAELVSLSEKLVSTLLTSGPEAVEVAKRLIGEVAGKTPEEAMPLTVRTIAERRASEEAREGLTAFLEKRHPAWVGKRKVEKGG